MSTVWKYIYIYLVRKTIQFTAFEESPYKDGARQARYLLVILINGGLSIYLKEVISLM